MTIATSGRDSELTVASRVQEAVEYNKYDWLVDEDNTPHGLLGIQPTRSITFVDNHDTGSTQAHWPFPKEKILEGYAYIMTHPGMPTVFWEHLYDVRPPSLGPRSCCPLQFLFLPSECSNVLSPWVRLLTSFPDLPRSPC